MATNIKGPGIYLAQFASDTAPFDSWASITKWAGGLGFKGVQIPSWDKRIFDMDKAAESQTYCDEIAGVARENGVSITELGTHLQGQLVAVHPAYDEAFDGFAPEAFRKNPKARQAWAVEQMKLSAKASKRLGLKSNVSFPGALAWPFPVPMAAAPGGFDRRRVRRARQALEADLRRLRRRGLQCVLRAAPRRGFVRRHHLRDVSGARQQPPALLHQLRPFALPAATARLPRVHRHLPRAHQGAAHQGRRVPPHRPAGRVFRLPAVGGTRRALPLAGRWAGGLWRHLLQDGPVQLRQLGRARMGVLPEAPRSRCGRRRGVHPQAHHPRHRKSLRRFRGWRHGSRRNCAACWACRRPANDDRSRLHSGRRRPPHSPGHGGRR